MRGTNYDDDDDDDDDDVDDDYDGWCPQEYSQTPLIQSHRHGRGQSQARPSPHTPHPTPPEKCELGLENSRLKNKTPGRRATSPREVITFFATQTCRLQG